MFIQGFYIGQKDPIFIWFRRSLHAGTCMHIQEYGVCFSSYPALFTTAAGCRTFVTNAQKRQDKRHCWPPNGHYKSGKISGKIRIISAAAQNPAIGQMNRSYSCIGKITRFLSFISIRTKFSRMNCTVRLLFCLPQARIHPSPGYSVTTPSSGLGKVRFFKTWRLAHSPGTAMGTGTSPNSPHEGSYLPKRFRLWFEPFTDRFDHIHHLEPLRELCTDV